MGSIQISPLDNTDSILVKWGNLKSIPPLYLKLDNNNNFLSILTIDELVNQGWNYDKISNVFNLIPDIYLTNYIDLITDNDYDETWYEDYKNRKDANTELHGKLIEIQLKLQDLPEVKSSQVTYTQAKFEGNIDPISGQNIFDQARLSSRLQFIAFFSELVKKRFKLFTGSFPGEIVNYDIINHYVNKVKKNIMFITILIGKNEKYK